MKRHIIVIIFSLVFVNPAYSCFIDFPPLEESVANSDIIIIGKGIEERLIFEAKGGEYKKSKMKFKVLEALKGDLKSNSIIEAITPVELSYKATCAIRQPQVGGVYFLFFKDNEILPLAFSYYHEGAKEHEEKAMLIKEIALKQNAQ